MKWSYLGSEVRQKPTPRTRTQQVDFRFMFLRQDVGRSSSFLFMFYFFLKSLLHILQNEERKNTERANYWVHVRYIIQTDTDIGVR